MELAALSVPVSGGLQEPRARPSLGFAALLTFSEGLRDRSAPSSELTALRSCASEGLRTRHP
eukprot:3854926-Alexandrium_andersonii.AAC.1